MPRTARIIDLSTRLPAAKPQTPDFDQEADNFIRDRLSLGASERTGDSYRESINKFRAYLVAQGQPLVLATIERGHITDFLGYLRDRKYSDNTIAIRYRSLRAWFNWLAQPEDGPLDRSPMAGLKGPKVVDRNPPILNDDQITSLQAACRGKGFVQRRDTAIIELFLDSGVRLGEIAGIRITDLDLTRMETGVDGKTGPRIVTFGADTARDIGRYLTLRANHPSAASAALWLGQRGPFTATGIGQMIERRALEAGIGRLHPHLFRHTWAHAYLANGGNETDLMRLAGWRSLEMVKTYGRSAGAERARDNSRALSLVSRLRRR